AGPHQQLQPDPRRSAGQAHGLGRADEAAVGREDPDLRRPGQDLRPRSLQAPRAARARRPYEGVPMNPARLRRFIGDMTSLVGGAWQDNDETATVEVGAKLLAELVKHDDWLPDEAAVCPPHGYVQNLLWCDPFERFSV